MNIKNIQAALMQAPDPRVCVAAAVIGSAVVGAATSAYGANAASSAANTQANAATAASQASLQATRETNQLNWNMYQQNLTNSSPYLQAGETALAALQNGMGLGQTQAAGAAPGANGTGGGAIGGGAGGSGTGSVLGAGASSMVGGAGASAGPTTTNAQGQTVDANGNVVTPSYTPTNYGASQAQLNTGANSVAPGQFQQTFTPSDLNLDPSYQFRLQQGELNLQASAAARGGLLTGQGAKDINDYAGQSASQEYQAAYDRFMNNQNTQYNRLAGLAGVGQTAVTADNTAGTTAANNITQNTQEGVSSSNNYLTGAAAAQAAGTIGSANAIAGGLNNAANSWANWQMLSNSPYYKGTTGMPVSSGGSGVVAGGNGITPSGWPHT